MKKDSRVKAVISLDAVEHNFREMRKNIAEETKMIAVIKADAYGHGAVPVAHLIVLIKCDSREPFLIVRCDEWGEFLIQQVCVFQRNIIW